MMSWDAIPFLWTNRPPSPFWQIQTVIDHAAKPLSHNHLHHLDRLSCGILYLVPYSNIALVPLCRISNAFGSQGNILCVALRDFIGFRLFRAHSRGAARFNICKCPVSLTESTLSAFECGSRGSYPLNRNGTAKVLIPCGCSPHETNFASSSADIQYSTAWQTNRIALPQSLSSRSIPPD